MDANGKHHSWSVDTVMHVGLAAVFFTATLGVAFWPELQSVVS